jgi:glycosyltransferase involved in cell wall biosynthesis
MMSSATPGRVAGDSMRSPRPVQIFVNALALRLGGGGTYIVEQLGALSALPGIGLTVFATFDIAANLELACLPSARIRALPERGVLRRLLYEQCVLPLHVRRYDVVYQPGGFALFASPRAQVVTNQNPHHFGTAGPQFGRRRYPWSLRFQLAVQRKLAHASVRRAEAFVTVSKASSAAIEEDLGRRPNLHVLRSPPPRLPDPADPIPALAGLANEPYVLTVANDYIHKDWDGLVRAFRDHPDLPPLVIAGAWRNDDRRRDLQTVFATSTGADRITLLGPVSDRSQVARLYRGATCFVAHSFLEVGPLTLGEALTSGLRLAASDIPPHRETCGTQAHYYDPADTDAIAAAVKRAIAGARPTGTMMNEDPASWAENAARLADLLRSVVRV